MEYASLMLSTFYGIAGGVTSNLRGVYIEHNNGSVCLNFYFDKPYSEDEIDFKVMTWSTPHPLPHEGWCVYLR